MFQLELFVSDTLMGTERKQNTIVFIDAEAEEAAIVFPLEMERRDTVAASSASDSSLLLSLQTTPFFTLC